MYQEQEGVWATGDGNLADGRVCDMDVLDHGVRRGRSGVVEDEAAAAGQDAVVAPPGDLAHAASPPTTARGVDAARARRSGLQEKQVTALCAQLQLRRRHQRVLRAVEELNVAPVRLRLHIVRFTRLLQLLRKVHQLRLQLPQRLVRLTEVHELRVYVRENELGYLELHAAAHGVHRLHVGQRNALVLAALLFELRAVVLVARQQSAVARHLSLQRHLKLRAAALELLPCRLRGAKVRHDRVELRFLQHRL